MGFSTGRWLRFLRAGWTGPAEPLAAYVEGPEGALRPEDVVTATCLGTMSDGTYVFVSGGGRKVVIPWSAVDRRELREFLAGVDPRAVSESLTTLLGTTSAGD